MTIFRSSATFLGLLIAGCSSGGSNLPAEDTAVGKIARSGNFGEISSGLKRFTEARLSQPELLQEEYLKAGFVMSRFRNDAGVACQSFHWKGKATFPVIMLVNICGQDVFANAGQIAP
jgi:hypothetical protein